MLRAGRESVSMIAVKGCRQIYEALHMLWSGREKTQNSSFSNIMELEDPPEHDIFPLTSLFASC